MFYPKCGSQNADETKFCRGCGADLGNVLAAISSTPAISTTPALGHPSYPGGELKTAEKHIELSSSGWRGLLVGTGFLIVAGLALGISTRLAVLSIFLLAFAVVFIGTGISRFVQARGLKRLREPRASGPALTPGHPDYIQPSRSLFETDDLTGAPRSVTEHTTTRLEIGRERIKDEG